MERCTRCTDMSLETECFKAGRCVLSGPAPDHSEEIWVTVNGYEDQHRVSSHGRFEQTRCPKGRRMVQRIQRPMFFGCVPMIRLFKPDGKGASKSVFRPAKEIWTEHFEGEFPGLQT